ncbi:TraG/TraD/VirD4 family protein [bacterium]|nr:TraG/TraD/VirD4 family protein [bacterium]
MKNSNPLANIYVCNDLIISGDLNRDATLTCGLAISRVELDNTSALHCANFENIMRSLLQAFSDSDFTFQIISSNSGDHTSELLGFYEDSKKANRWSRQQRNADFLRFNEQIEASLISRKEVHFFISRKLPKQNKQSFSAEDLEGLLKVEAKAFEVPLEQIRHSLQLVGGNAERLSDEQLFVQFDKALNPSQHPYDEKQAQHCFNPENSISENCLRSDMMPIIDDADGGFCMDGVYHSVLVLKALPSLTTSGIISQLSNLPLKNYSLSLITRPLDLEQEISKQEDQISKLQKTVSSSNKARFNTLLQKCSERLDRLASGEVAPYQMQLTIICWDSEMDALKSKVGILKSAILRFQRAQYYSVTNPVYARNFFLSRLPGSPVIEDAFMIETEDVTVANLLPLNSGDDDSLTKAEGIYQTSQGGLFGLSVFTDQKGEPHVRHGLITGKTGFGKSASTIHFLTQLQPHTDHMFIVEDGGSYLGYVSTFGINGSLILDKNGNSTLNYLSTRGLPLTHQHLSDTAIFARLMIDKDESQRFSTTKLRGMLHRFYLDYAEEWTSKNKETAKEIAMEYQQAKQFFLSDPNRNPNALISNQYEDFLDWKRQNPEKYEELQSILPEDLTNLNSSDLAQLAYAFMSEEEMPTHSQLHDWLCAKLPNPSKRQKILLSSFEAFRADAGQNGCLFDGVSTFSFSQEVVHVELGRISEQDKRLKQMAGFLIANSFRNTITRMDRSKTKLVVFEELGSFLKFPNAEEIVADYYQRGRKYNVSVFSIIQEITKIPETLRSSILSNSSLALLFRQEDTETAEELQRAFKLPDSTTLALSKLAKPTKEHGASFVSWQSGDDTPVIHMGRVIVSPEMFYILASDGESHEKRQVALRNYEDVIEGIQIEANRTS